SPMVPLLATRAKARDWTDFRRIFRRRLVWMGALTGSGFLLFLLVGRRCLELVIGHGGVTSANVADLWRIMVALVGILVAGAMGQVTSVSFYAFGDTRTPTRLGMLTFTAYIPAKIAAFFWFGLIGLAAATSLYYFASLLVQLWALRRAIDRLDAAEHGAAA
ncbi:MAG TPA: lipid II flippase MurJ, partial [Thermoanaerobaculia bacterium]|nr:lipid II flippase MurJ [Thermoanaerobaculia bacterium]